VRGLERWGENGWFETHQGNECVAQVLEGVCLIVLAWQAVVFVDAIELWSQYASY